MHTGKKLYPWLPMFSPSLGFWADIYYWAMAIAIGSHWGTLDRGSIAVQYPRPLIEESRQRLCHQTTPKLLVSLRMGASLSNQDWL